MDANSCIYNINVIITQPGAALTVNTTKVDVLCFGALTGSATAIPAGGTAPYTYSWNTVPVQTTATATSLAAGPYIVTVTDANSCVATANVTINQPAAALTVSTTQIDVSCYGGSTGSATAIPAGGTGPYTYSWNTVPVQTTATATGLSAGPYTVTVTDANSCVTTANVTINQPAAALTIATTQVDVSCFGESTGSATSIPAGGTAPYTYSWNTVPVQTTATATGLAAGPYTVTVTDANSCVATANVTIFEPAALIGSTVVTNVLCFGDINGGVDLTVTGGTAPYTYLWSNGATTEDLVNVAAGTYNVTITDANGCTALASGTVTGPAAALSGNTVVTNVLCFGNATGGVDLTVTGGTAPYTYLWSNGATTEDLTNVVAGTYDVIITDANGCTATASGTVTEPAAILSGSTVVSDVLCSGDATGGIDLTVSGGTAPYTYLWDTGETTEDLTNIIAGVYTVTITDANGCTAIASGTVSEPAVLSGTTVVTDVLCFGDLTGGVDLTVSGGTAPYTYLWNTGAVTEDLSNVAAGAYSVIITDVNSCTTIASGMISEPGSAVSGSITSQTDVTVYGGNDGSVTVDGSGGTPPYQYKLDAGSFQASGTFNTLTAGSYTVTVQDANLCTFDVPVTIMQPSVPLTGTVTAQTDVLCFGDNSGSVTVEGADGILPFEYSLDGGAYQALGTFNNLTAGPHTVTIRDALLTTFDVPVTILQPAAALVVTTTQVDVFCGGGNTGSSTATASGGTAPYAYSWSTTPVQTTATATGLSAGPYTVTVTDANGCTANTNVTILEPPPVTVSTTQVNVMCNDGSDGSATAVAAGGTAPYTYSWNTTPVQTTANASGLAAGSYIVTATDANGCAGTASVSITEPAALALDPTTTEAKCPDTNDGSITLGISGGTTPYIVIWSDGITTQNRSNVAAGIYSVVVTDANGCAASTDVTVSNTGSYDCLEIPDIITPDPADGFNDTWIIKNIDLYPNAEVKIYTRWGKLIFHTKNLSANPWDGRYKGKLMPTDSYHYILYLNDGSDPRSGVISVIR
jgi:gliding motility-associated-like protein